jgi:hypothetical protein
LFNSGARQRLKHYGSFFIRSQIVSIFGTSFLIEFVGGARSNVLVSTDAGELHIKAVPRGDWQIRSASGNVRVELPPGAQFEVDAASKLGEIEVERDDIRHSDDIHHLRQAVNGGGTLLRMSTESGKIGIQ